MARFYGSHASVGPVGLIVLGPLYLVVWLFGSFVRFLMRTNLH